MAKKWSPKEDQFIKDNYLYMTSKEMAEHLDRSLSAIDKRRNDLGCIKHKTHVYTDDMDNFISDNIKNYTLPELRSLFNEHFQTDVTQDGLNEHLRYAGIFRNLSKQEKSELTHKSKSKSIHYESLTKDGYIIVKVKNDKYAKHSNWRFKHHIVWESHMGEIPKGYQVGFLDGDKSNFDINNLVAYPVKWTSYLRWLCKGRTHRELTITALMCCQLHYKCKNEFYIGKESKNEFV